MPLELQLALKARATASANPVARLFRAVSKELPRVLTIYDMDIPLSEAKAAVRNQFQRNAQVKDPRVVDMLVEKGYMDLEETLLQHKQRSHLQRTFTGYIEPKGANRKRVLRGATIDEQFARGY